ncbi:hypothetical protein Bca101_010116 [Brassica carinata]
MELSTGEEGFGGEARRSLVLPSTGVSSGTNNAPLKAVNQMAITGRRGKQLGMHRLVVNNGLISGSKRQLYLCRK